jgi:hypothetical protein
MAITRPKTKTAKAEAFISGAPDAEKPRGVRKGNRQQISLTIAPDLLLKVDALAAKLGQSRAAVINMAIYRAIESGIAIDGLRSESK